MKDGAVRVTVEDILRAVSAGKESYSVLLCVGHSAILVQYDLESQEVFACNRFAELLF